MKLTVDAPGSSHVIRTYTPAGFRIGQRECAGSVIVSAGTLIENWRPRDIAGMEMADLEPAPAPRAAARVPRPRIAGRPSRSEGRLRGHEYGCRLPHLQRHARRGSRGRGRAPARPSLSGARDLGAPRGGHH